MERLDVEEAVLHLGGIVFEPLIDAAAGTGGLAELAAGGDLLGLEAAHRFLDKGVVVGQVREGGQIQGRQGALCRHHRGGGSASCHFLSHRGSCC